MRKIPLLAHNVDKRAIAPFGMKTLDGLIQLRSVGVRFSHKLFPSVNVGRLTGLQFHALAFGHTEESASCFQTNV
ncbi:MAG: hypothetical protein EBR73_09685 [Rhodobacteraceae bacterium]|jgi:hypothetical protein|nr:hypothetical protein [Paracoccaceae bacterium]